MHEHRSRCLPMVYDRRSLGESPVHPISASVGGTTLALLNPAILDQSLVPVKLISQSEEDPKENSGDGFGVNLPYGCWVRLKVAKIG